MKKEQGMVCWGNSPYMALCVPCYVANSPYMALCVQFDFVTFAGEILLICLRCLTFCFATSASTYNTIIDLVLFERTCITWLVC